MLCQYMKGVIAVTDKAVTIVTNVMTIRLMKIALATYYKLPRNMVL
jgi:hypothetical protein